MTDYDETSNDLSEINLTENESLIDLWMEDPQFASSGRTDRRMSSVPEQDAQDGQLNCSSAEETQQQSVASNIHLKKKKCPDNISQNAVLFQEPLEQTKEMKKRELNKKYAKESRERKKQTLQNENQNFKELMLKQGNLNEEVGQLKNIVHDLAIVKSSLIHQECCGQGCNDVDINVPRTKQDLLVPTEKRVQSAAYYKNLNISNNSIFVASDGQQVILAARQQQEQQPFQQEAGGSVMSSILAMPSNPYAFISNATSFPSMPTANPVLLNPNLDPLQSVNLEVSNTESSAVILENVKGQPGAINTPRFCQEGLPINSRPINIPYTSQDTTKYSPWYVETPQEPDIEMQKLESFFSKS